MNVLYWICIEECIQPGAPLSGRSTVMANKVDGAGWCFWSFMIQSEFNGPDEKALLNSLDFESIKYTSDTPLCN